MSKTDNRPTILWTYAAVALCMLSIAALSHAAGFNCAKAKTTTEKLICSDSALSALDSKLKSVFEEAQSETSGLNGETGEVIDPVGKEQKRWIRQVRDACSDIDCLKSAYTSRIDKINRTWLNK